MKIICPCHILSFWKLAELEPERKDSFANVCGPGLKKILFLEGMLSKIFFLELRKFHILSV